MVCQLLGKVMSRSWLMFKRLASLFHCSHVPKCMPQKKKVLRPNCARTWWRAKKCSRNAIDNSTENEKMMAPTKMKIWSTKRTGESHESNIHPTSMKKFNTSYANGSTNIEVDGTPGAGHPCAGPGRVSSVELLEGTDNKTGGRAAALAPAGGPMVNCSW